MIGAFLSGLNGALTSPGRGGFRLGAGGAGKAGASGPPGRPRFDLRGVFSRNGTPRGPDITPELGRRIEAAPYFEPGQERLPGAGSVIRTRDAEASTALMDRLDDRNQPYRLIRNGREVDLGMQEEPAAVSSRRPAGPSVDAEVGLAVPSVSDGLSSSAGPASGGRTIRPPRNAATEASPAPAGAMATAGEPALTFGDNPGGGVDPMEPDRVRPNVQTGIAGDTQSYMTAPEFEPLPITGAVDGVDPELLDMTARAWGYVVPGGSISVSTGVSDHSPVNHGPGHAVDFRVTRPDGSVVRASDPEMLQAAQIGRSLGVRGIGYGEGPTGNYMGGVSAHWDISRHGPRSWGDDDGGTSDSYGAGSPEHRAAIDAATGRPVEEVLGRLGIGQGGDPQQLSFGQSTFTAPANSPRSIARSIAPAGGEPLEATKSTRAPTTQEIDADPDTRLMLARTLQAEAGNQGYEGMLDVGAVIRNRLATRRWGDTISDVVMAPAQFSAWNGVTGAAGGAQGQNMDFQPSAEALRAADVIMAGDYEDRTGGATHYYADLSAHGLSGVPSWSNSTFRQIDGDHYFGRADGDEPVQGNTGRIYRSNRSGKKRGAPYWVDQMMKRAS